MGAVGIRTSCVGPTLQVENSKDLLDTHYIKRHKEPRCQEVSGHPHREAQQARFPVCLSNGEMCLCPGPSEESQMEILPKYYFSEQGPEKQKHSQLIPNSLEAIYLLFQGKRVKKVSIKLPQFVGNSGMVTVYLT